MDKPTVEPEKPASILSLEEAASMLNTALPDGSFHFDVSAWLHGGARYSSVSERLDIAISVWCHEMQQRFHGATLLEATSKCRDGIVTWLKETAERAQQEEDRARQFRGTLKEAENQLAARKESGR